MNAVLRLSSMSRRLFIAVEERVPPERVEPAW
jgi:hypothetical protein